MYALYLALPAIFGGRVLQVWYSDTGILALQYTQCLVSTECIRSIRGPVLDFNQNKHPMHEI